jgi:uncharacterized protein (TIGR02391 family)
MTSIDSIGGEMLAALLDDFQTRGFGMGELKDGYIGPSLPDMRAQYGENPVNFELAIEELEKKKLIKTGPMAPYENKPGSSIAIFAVFSKREFLYLTEGGYKRAHSVPRAPRSRVERKAVNSKKELHFYGIHPEVLEKCGDLYEAGQFAEAVEKSFKVVRDRLRALTGHERGSEAFGKGKLHIRGAAAPHVDQDFNSAVKYLTMAIDMFRNEKSHTSDARIDDPIRAHQYLSLSSLAMYLLENADSIENGA